MIVVKQWTPRCSARIKEIYDNLPERGNAFLEKRLNILYEQFRHMRKEGRSNLFQKLSSLKSQVKPEIPEEEAKHQVNFKPFRENAKKIEYLRKEGLTDFKLFEVLVLMETSLEISPSEPSVEERKEIPEIETKKPSLEEKPLETREEEVISDLLANRCDTKYLHCVSKPFTDKDRRLYINCVKPIFKQNRYGNWIPSGKYHGKIPIEQCMSMQRYELKKKEEQEKPKDRLKPCKSVEEEKIDVSELPKIRELTIEEIVDQLGVCENPIIMHSKTLLCHLCEKRDPQKWQACQKIQKELHMPVASHRLMRIMTSKLMEEKELRENPYWWWQTRKTEDMTSEEIEKELGLKFDPSSYEDVKFDAIRKRYEQICVNCEEHFKHECNRYCKEFLSELDSVQNSST